MFDQATTINDWKKYTRCEKIYKECKDRFFDVISKWTQDKLKKLLKFVTGTAVVPIGGFKNFATIGGQFTLDFYDGNQSNLPVAQACFNSLDIPCYKSNEILESKLSMAIEFVEFGCY